MANTITDNRTLLFDGGDGTGGAPDDLAGVATGTADTSTYLQGANSYTYSASNSRSGMLFDAGTAQNWSSNVFYFTVNSGVVGLLDTKANGGFTIRFCGATVTNWFEVYVGGSDDWPPSIQGGWTNFVVDIELARSTAVTNGWTNGTVPATTAIRYAGFSQILTTMPKMADNTWFDTVHRLPDGTAGILVQGRSGGTTAWTANNILTQLGSGQMAYRRGAGGAYVLSTPIQFGINDTSTHGFADTNVIWLWDNQEYAPTDLYKVSALGNIAGTTNVTLGTKTGTGDDATGAQGFTIAASATGVRWAMDFDDANLNTIGLYGNSFIHGGDFQLDTAANDVISTLFIDCTSARTDNSNFLRNGIIDANTADGVAFITTDDLTDIKFCNFQFSDGHAVEMTTPRVASQASKGNIFSNYGSTGTNDAALYNNTAGAVTVAVSDGGSTPTYRNGTSATTSTVNEVVVKFTAKDKDGVAIENARIYVEAAPGGSLPSDAAVTITRVTVVATVAHTGHGYAVAATPTITIRGADQDEYNGAKSVLVVDANTYTFTVSGSPTTPATFTAPHTAIRATHRVLTGLTNASGILQDTGFNYSADQPVRGVVRKST